ncbi:MAG: DUF882 domain-containing protein [Thermodesulfobacteriota bacterium]|nr:MAG: DUF882 domain-containing protein [Thermodesulfobacteriota bacterium]
MIIDRRRFFKIGAQAALFGIFPLSAIAATDRLSASKRSLFLYNTHTGQKLDVCYYAQDQYQSEALKKINDILRDHRTGEIKPIRKELLNLLHSISKNLDRPPRFHIISGYRSPETNARLRINNKSVSKHSLHMKGEAADIRVPGCDTRWLRNVCMQLKAGGVGYYPKSDFVHVDIGPVRHW